MEIGFVSFDMPWSLHGGVEVHVDRIASALAARGDDVTVVTRRPPDDERPYEVRTVRHPDALQGLLVPYYRFRIATEAVFARRASRLARRLDLDVVHFQDYAGRPDLLDGPLRAATIHVTHRANYEEGRRTMPDGPTAPLRRWIQDRVRERQRSRAARYVDALDVVVAVSDAMAEDLVAEHGVDVEVIPNGVDPIPDVPSPKEARRRLDLPAEDRIVLFLGRLEPVKRPLSLLELAGDGTTVVYAGTGSLADRIAEAADERPGVRYLGRVSEADKHRLYAAADLFSLPSRSEGQPVAILEALAHGTPVHTTRPEWVPEELRAYCTFGDLADRVDEAVGVAVDPDAVPTWEEVADRYRALYERRRSG